MIADVLVLLKNCLNEHFKSLSVTGLDATEDKVVFVGGVQNSKSYDFKLGAVSLILFNIERDVINRQADCFVRVDEDGSTRKVSPAINITLDILFVANFKDYEQSLHYLSFILAYFRATRYLDRKNFPNLNPSIGHVVLELNSLTMTQQHELWGLLSSSYLPSLAYKVKALSFVDDGEIPITQITDVILNQKQL